jgi:hypothetical protein
MPAVEGIVGPGISTADINMDIPSCVKLANQADADAFKAFMDTCVKAALRHASEVLGDMLAKTPGAEDLKREFSAKLGV